LTRIAYSQESTSGLEGVAVPAGHAFITEMFSGIQGEGPYVGVRQVFVRLGGCDLRCSWCDTPGSLVRRGPGRYESSPGTREFTERPNPIPLGDAASLLAALHPETHHSVTFTGGEPLLQPEAVATLSKSVHASGGRTWLETHGGRRDDLAAVIDGIDFISMDLKLQSSCDEDVPLEVHRDFLALAVACDVFTKIVVTPSTLDNEVVAAARMVASVSSGCVLILQQVTPFGRVKTGPDPEQMLRLQRKCLEVHRDVRVIPQTHKLTGQM
jgi:7-carboxy-7-deazaguanine synthase